MSALARGLPAPSVRALLSLWVLPNTRTSSQSLLPWAAKDLMPHWERPQPRPTPAMDHRFCWVIVCLLGVGESWEYVENSHPIPST